MQKRTSKLAVFHKDKNKQYVMKIRFYPPLLYGRLDKWLKNMSLKGLHIVHCGIFYFLFEKGEPKEKEYFTYTYFHRGEFCISLRHPFLEKIYGVKLKKSRLNSNRRKTHNIVEIDTKRIDIQNNVGYKELVRDRNQLILKHFLTRTLPAVIIIILSVLAIHIVETIT